MIPAPPTIDGEPSAGHDSPTWTWTASTGAVSYRYRLDGGAWVTTSDMSHRASGLSAGSYTIEVVACRADGMCSSAASFTTEVEVLGPGYTGVWAGVAKADLATTPLGHITPLSCHNCYNGPSNEVYDTAAASAKIVQAMERGADLIELDIADASGVLCVHHSDPDSCAGAPTLETIIADATLRDADAMLFIELKEGDLAPAAFATSLLDLLDGHREVVSNGRPLFVRAFNNRRAYLSAIQTAASAYPMIAPYLRYSVLYGNTTTAVATMQANVAADVGDAGFDMVEFHYQQNNFAGVADYAQSLGLGVGIWTIPGAFGEVFVASMREEVDQITAEFRIDQARAVLEEANTFAYLNATDCVSGADTQLDIVRNFTGSIVREPFTINQSPTASSMGTPGLQLDVIGEDRFGCSLDYRASMGMTQRSVNLGSNQPPSGAGFLVTALVNFDTLAGLNGTQAILNSSEGGGFALELIGDGTTVRIRFGVHVGGNYRFHTYNIASTGLPTNEVLNGGDSYFLVGAYDGSGGVYLWVNHERSGSGGNHTGDVRDSGQPALVGADPQPSAGVGGRFFFNGLVQQSMILSWGDHGFSGSQVN